MDVTADWFWEGNVVVAIAHFLKREGWEIVSKADTYTKERGVDIQARRAGKVLLIEVKGFPSTKYRDPRRVDERKPTNPANQAQHWYSHALLKAMRLQSKYPDAIVALGFPDFSRYRNLFEETCSGLQKLGVAFLTVHQSGDVDSWNL